VLREPAAPELPGDFPVGCEIRSFERKIGVKFLRNRIEPESRIALEISGAESHALVIVRNVATFMIVLCHICEEIPGLGMFAQVFNVGIYVFFVLSGYLYGRKNVSGNAKWLVQRFLRLMLPCYCYYLVSYLLLMAMDEAVSLQLDGIILAVFDLQGFILRGLGGVVIPHLWFMSHIMVCYLLTPLFGHLKRRNKRIEQVLLPLIVVAAQIGFSAVFGGVYVHLAGILAYYLAYLFADSIRNWTGKQAALLCMTALAAMCLRIFFIVSGLDDRYAAVYEILVVPYGQLLFGSAVFVTICLFVMKIYSAGAHTKWKRMMQVISEYSIDIYIVHYSILVGCFATVLKEAAGGSSLRYALLGCLSCAAGALLIHGLSDKIHKILKKI
jgi:peptidoglycan/LPS O-acetylase OafA/YrhL